MTNHSSAGFMPPGSNGPRLNKPSTHGFPQISEKEYRDLVQMARALHRRCPSWTLTPTALTHEALLKLQAWPGMPPPGQTHFMAVAARAMRHLLVDAVRKKLYTKHGFGLKFVPLTERAGKVGMTAVEFLDMNRALDKLDEISPRQAQAVIYSNFFGHTVEEIAALLEVSSRTVQRDLRTANAWLASRIGSSGEK